MTEEPQDVSDVFLIMR